MKRNFADVLDMRKYLALSAAAIILLITLVVWSPLVIAAGILAEIAIVALRQYWGKIVRALVSISLSCVPQYQFSFPDLPWKSQANL